MRDTGVTAAPGPLLATGPSTAERPRRLPSADAGLPVTVPWILTDPPVAVVYTGCCLIRHISPSV